MTQTIKDRCIRSSILKMLEDSAVTAEMEPGQPQEFDPNSETHKQWYLVKIETIKWEDRRQTQAEAKVTISIEVNTRTMTNTYETERLYDQLLELFYPNKLTNVLDYDQSSPTVVGRIHWDVAPVSSLVEKRHWQCRRATIGGTYYAS